MTPRINMKDVSEEISLYIRKLRKNSGLKDSVKQLLMVDISGKTWLDVNVLLHFFTEIKLKKNDTIK